MAGEAEVCPRHLSFIESGRASPSRDLQLRLAEPLEMSLRERNWLLLAGGYAPVHGERTLDEPELSAALQAFEAVLASHMPFPALALDRQWNLVHANYAAHDLLEDVATALLEPPINVQRTSLHAECLAQRIANLA